MRKMPCRGSGARLPFIATGMGLRKWRAIVSGAGALMCIWMIAGNATKVVSAILAQAASNIPSPPSDSPIMSPGLRVRRPCCLIEIKTFSRSRRGDDSVFEVEFVIINDSRESVTFHFKDDVRLIADGLPRAPEQVCNEYSMTLPIESSEYCQIRFSVRGVPSTIYFQI